MSVSGVNNIANQASWHQDAARNQQNAHAQQNSTNGLTQAGVFLPSGASASQFRPDREVMSRISSETERRSQQMMELVERIFGTQARTFETAVSELRSALEDGREVDPEIVAQAQRDIADDGYFGVEQTSRRILDFARAISGGDPSRINVLRDAVERGFQAAERAWGGSLPEISRQTLEAVRQGFDDWAAEPRVGNLNGNQVQTV